jgi:hypothetical protein
MIWITVWYNGRRIRLVGRIPLKNAPWWGGPDFSGEFRFVWGANPNKFGDPGPPSGTMTEFFSRIRER